MPSLKKKNNRPREVFLSHSHHDGTLTRKIASELRRHNIEAWFSEHHIRGAQEWQDEIGAALGRCDWMVVLLTPESVKSKWVRREVSFALDDDRYEGHVIPLIVRTCKPAKLNWALNTLQMITHTNVPTTSRTLLGLWNVTYRKK